MSDEINAVLTTSDLTVGYDRDIVEKICLSVMPGKIVTLIGPNGSGKSTLLATVTGQLKSRGGMIFIDGKDRGSLSRREAAKRLSMVMTFAVRPELMTCREVIESGRYPYTGMLGKLSGEDIRAVDRASEICECGEIEKRLITDISDGQRQRVMLARAIAQEPAVLVLDEPTSFLDIRYKIDILSKIRYLTEKENIAVLMSMHEPETAMRISDTVIAIGEGRVLRMGTPEEVFEESFIRRLYNMPDADVSLLGTSPWLSKKTSRPEAVTALAVPERSRQADTANARAKAVPLMIMGTMSNVGKSMITAGLCRIFAQDGLKVAPFKSQNMANNSFVTDEGLEMGRAQVVQAECAKTNPCVSMNPILLKPTGERGSQVIVNGEVAGNMSAAEYFEYKKGLVPEVLEAYDRLSREYDVIVVEGAGSPVELNLKDDDIVNTGLAAMIDAPVLLVGDIDRGGVFAQLLGTIDLLEEDERRRIKGLIVNKFRGDPKLFGNGITMLEDRAKCPVLGVVPYMQLHIDDEDSLSEKLDCTTSAEFDIAVVRLPYISNFTDLAVFEQSDDVSVRYVSDPARIGDPDVIILPGSKNTIGDMRWLEESGMAERIRYLSAAGNVIIGICGGYQMLGRTITDPGYVEGRERIDGLGLLPVTTVMRPDKTRRSFEGEITEATGVLSSLKKCPVRGYEIHMGITEPLEELSEFTSAGSGYCSGNVYGSYVHGLFDTKEAAAGLIRSVASFRGKTTATEDIIGCEEFKEAQYDLLAQELRNCLDIDEIYRIMGVFPGRKKENI